MEAHIFKVLRRDEWNSLDGTGVFKGSADDVRDGFIHLSTAEQIPGTLARHFSSDVGRGEDDLHLVWIEELALGAALKWETSRGGSLFPHLYEPLLLGHVVQAVALEVEPAGRHVLPENFPEVLQDV